ELPTPLTFGSVYSKAALYEAALKVYTKPLFQPSKGFVASHDGRTLYDFASRGARNMQRLHAALLEGTFHFGPAVEVHFRRGHGRRRTAYIFPWQERIVDQLLYQTLNKALHPVLSDRTFAFRYRGFGVDACQHRVATVLRDSPRPLYVVKRDVSNYYPSINPDILLALLEPWIDQHDYLSALLRECIRFHVRTETGDMKRGPGAPFGTALSCLFANIYLTPVDSAVAELPDATYFRYADDILVFSRDHATSRLAAERMTDLFAKLQLRSKASHELDLVLGGVDRLHTGLTPAGKFQHLGLEYRADGSVGLPAAKWRKLRSLFRRRFEEARGELRAFPDPIERLRHLVAIARNVMEQGFGSTAIVDYYLKHVDDENQLRLLDRWLADEVLARGFGTGHRKGNFRRVSFRQLRTLGLPSLRHRRRLLQHQKLESRFFTYMVAARQSADRFARVSPIMDGEGRGRLPGRKTLSPRLEAAVNTSPVR
ncbi:MAG TPA: RNA-directed DNA polymerase, partial [Gemmatimonadaceae bacterium]|nr:RNA-directed DNA polymerase [Gemmatimonadaceae bacterium]